MNPTVWSGHAHLLFYYHSQLLVGLWFESCGRGESIFWGEGGARTAAPGSHCSDYKLQLSSLWSEL